MTEPAESIPAEAAAPSTVARSAGLVAGGVGVAALVGALAVYLTGSRPYAVNVPGMLLYVGGLGAALTASVLLWMAWGEREPDWSPGRARLGVVTATGALLFTCACAVVSISSFASGGAQLALMGVTAAVLAVAVLVARPTRP